MLNWVSLIVIGIIYNLFFSYTYLVLTKSKKINLNMRNIGIILLISILYAATVIYGADIKIITTVFRIFLTIFMLKVLYKDRSVKISITAFLMYLLLAISELIFALLIVGLFRVNQEFLTATYLGILISNIIILLISIMLLLVKSIKKFITNIIDWSFNKNIFNEIIIIILALIVIGFLGYQNYVKITSIFSFILTNIFLVGVLSFVIGFYKEKTENNKLTSGYDNLLDYVKTYEELLEAKNKNQHEYKNQLLLIKEMLGKTNKKAKKYIDDLLEVEEHSEEVNWINKFKNIPNGGLKGLIYYKISEMTKKNIRIYVDINDNVNNERLNKYLNDNLADISKIIGVYLDNAREAVIESNKKYLVLEAECDKEKFSLSISNTYKGNINIDKLDEEGYSKKGKGRGYGLSLVKDIISKRKDITQSREMNGMFYVQTVNFNYKK